MRMSPISLKATASTCLGNVSFSTSVFIDGLEKPRPCQRANRITAVRDVNKAKKKTSSEVFSNMNQPTFPNLRKIVLGHWMADDLCQCAFT